MPEKRWCFFCFLCFYFTFTGNYLSRVRDTLFLDSHTVHINVQYSSYSLIRLCIPQLCTHIFWYLQAKWYYSDMWIIKLHSLFNLANIFVQNSPNSTRSTRFLTNWSGHFWRILNSSKLPYLFDTDSQFYEMRHNNFLPRKIARIYTGQLLLDLLLLLAVAPFPFAGVLFDVVIYDSAVGRNKDHITVTRLFQCVLRWVVGFSVIVSQWTEHLSTENIFYTWAY